MSELMMAIVLLKKVFDDYAAACDGNKETLSRAEVKMLLEKELGLEGADQAEVDKMIQTMDCSNDNEIDFTEFMTFVSSIAIIMFEICRKKCPE